VNGSEPMRGSIEFDLTDRNWEEHGHATNPAFEDTVLHVFVHPSERTFFARTRSNREVRQVQADPNALAETLSANVPARAAGSLSGAAEKFAGRPRAQCAGCGRPIPIAKKGRTHSEQDRQSRSRRSAFSGDCGRARYKQNKLPFTLLAQRLPLRLLRANSIDAEAMLFGVAGFLQASDLDVYERSARKYVRQLWDRWWPHRDALQQLILPAKIWRLSGTRPLNHPQRRLAALAAILEKWQAFVNRWAKRVHAPRNNSFSRLRIRFGIFITH